MRTCRICKTKFMPRYPLQSVCDAFECRCEYAQQVAAKSKRAREKAERDSDRQKREQMKTRSQWMKEAQREFNSYIRNRDTNKSCISCGRPLVLWAVGGGFDCGHYRSVGSAPHLRFDERNAHGQCKKCNRWDSGRAVDYRIGLIRRIGLAAVEALEADQTVMKWTIDDLKAIKAEYIAKLKALKSESIAA